MNADRQRAVATQLGDIVTCDEVLAPFTTYRLGGPAAVVVRPRTVDDLVAVGRAAEGDDVLVVGRGSNLLIADQGFDGIVVLLEQLAGADRIDIVDDAVEVGGAAALPVVARRTVAASLAGFEWAVGVPGSIGGAVRMNAGGHGSDMAATLDRVEIVDLRAGTRAWVDADRLGLRFRGSDLADHHVVISAVLRLAAGDRVAGEALLADIVHWRREHQPGGQNAGSVFVNPVPGSVAAAQLIDGLGLRGFRIGGAHVSEKHANFIQAGEGCTAADVRAVMEHVRAAVAASTGIVLRSEIRMAGFLDAGFLHAGFLHGGEQ
jgi:UDP-N-acetylmuramate dehydrogenase